MLGDTRLSFETLADPPGFEIADNVEQLRYRLHTPEPVSPTPVPTDQFHFPVESGVRLVTDELVLPSVVSLFVRDDDGGMVSEIEHLDSESFGSGSYILELSTQIKTYIEVEGPVDITADLFELRFAFEEPTAVDVGVRSRHNRPAATVTTTEEPVDLMAAISTFGSALKSTSPERSFPTLRGHPPLVEVGDGFDAPASLSKPETDVAIELPRDWGDVYRASSLAFYLGADVRPGDERALVVDGDRYSLQSDHGFEREVTGLLKHVFFLDCVVRTEGLYTVDLHERAAVADDLEFDLSDAYEASLADRLASYLEVPRAVTRPHWPRWKQTVDVAPEPGRIESLPFVVNDLAEIRIPRQDEEPPDVREEPEAVTSFLRTRVRLQIGRAHV